MSEQNSRTAHRKRFRIPALLLAGVVLAGCALPRPVAAPPVAPARAEEDRRAAFEEAFQVYRGGNVDRALQRFRAMPDHPPAVAAIALLENRPEAVLALPTTDDVPLLIAQSTAAMLLGDVDAGERIQRRLPVPPPAAVAGLGPWLAAARLGRARPVQRVTGEAPAQASFDASRGLPVITVRVGDRTERFLFDTGASMTVIDARAADRLGVRRAAGAEITGEGAAGSVRESLGMIDHLEILGLTLEDVPVGVSDLGPSAAAYDVAGVLGVQQLLRHDVVSIDYGARHIERSRRSRAEGWPMVFLVGDAISVKGKLEGGSEGLFQIDTGVDAPIVSSAYLTVGRALHARWNVGPVEQRVVHAAGRDLTVSVQTIGGARFCALGDASPSCLDMGAVSVRSGLVEAHSRGIGIDHVGVLGGSAFQDRVLELDYPALRIRVRPSG